MFGQIANSWVLAGALLLGLSACPPSTAELTGETNPTSSTSTTDPTTDTSTGSTAASSTTEVASTTEASSTTSEALCGDGVVEGEEACDDGNSEDGDACLNTCEVATCGDGVVHKGEEACDDGNLEDGDACLNTCEVATCGDGVVHTGQEQCDEGEDNAFGVYGGCTPFCTNGPRCGDGLLDPEEACDDGSDGDPSDGCLDDCTLADSCLSIKDLVPDAETGIYKIVRYAEELEVDVETKVWCDMDTDGGGYTFLKVDTQKQGNSPALSAALAEAVCGEYGLRLLAPRTRDHAEAAYYLAVTKNIVPVGGGMLSSDPSYMSILGIYPKIVGQSCVGAPFNSEDCSEWQAGDGGPFWVSNEGIPGQPSTSNCEECSMYYEWFEDGTIASYFALKAGGFSSARFLCAVGDKKGP